MDASNSSPQPYRNSIPEHAPVRQDSYFDGNTWQLIGKYLLSFLVCTLTLGIAYPWMLCMLQRWKAKHTVIHGRRLRFDGRGHQLIGKYLLWMLLTFITLGIYGIWLGLKMKKWVVKHTFYADEDRQVESFFSGGAGGFLGIHLLAYLITSATLGIGKAWADVEVLKWEAKHTHIGGSPLEFNGTGGSLFVKYLLLTLLTPLTLGIYAIFWPIIYTKWAVRNTEAVYQTQRIQSQAKAHEAEAIKDYSKFHIAAAEQEISAIRSGYTGNEDQDALEKLAQSGNPFACCRLAEILKGDSSQYEGRARELLQIAANSRIHSALYALAIQLPAEQSVPMLEEAARCGNAEAAWRLAEHYLDTGNLYPAAYWFRLSIEWEHPEAMARTDDYHRLVTDIALRLSEAQHSSGKSSHKALAIVFCVIGCLLAIGVIGGAVLWLVTQSPLTSGMQGVTGGIFNIVGEMNSDTVSSMQNIQEIDGSCGFFDSERRRLYLDFAQLPYSRTGNPYVRIGNDDWLSEPVYPDEGINEIPLDGSEDVESGPLYLFVYDPDTDTATEQLHIRIETGGSDDADRWLADRKTDGENTGGLAGEWIRIDSGEDFVITDIRTLRDDGTFERNIITYGPVYDAYSWVDFSYDGMEWYHQWEEDTYIAGTYTVSGSKIIFRFDGTEEEYEITQTDGRQYMGGEDGWVKASPVVGTWTTARMETPDYDGSEGQTMLYVTYLTIKPDGMFSRLEIEYVWLDPGSNALEWSSPVEGTNWGIPAMGFPSDCGTYELSETELQLHTLWDDVGNRYDDYAACLIEYQPDGTLLIDGTTYYRGNCSLSEVCGLFGYPVN